MVKSRVVQDSCDVASYVLAAYIKLHKSGEPSLPVDSVPLSPRKKLYKSSVTLKVSNEINGVQTTKVFKPGSLKTG